MSARILQPPNARFWTWYLDGWVKLTLKPGQTLGYTRGGRHDEGWFRESVTWELAEDGSEVIRQSDSDGTDCDGRMSHSSTDSATRDKLRAVDQFATYPVACNLGIYRPAWSEVEASQRDYSAEAMNY